MGKLSLGPTVEAEVVRRYKAGEKTVVIQAEYGLSPGSLYRILHRNGVGLRTEPLRVLKPFELRDYQRDCLTSIETAYAGGTSRQLVALPTGTGKTVIFAQLPHIFDRKMLVLAHREELLEQARDKLLLNNPRLRVEIEQAGRRASLKSDVVIASVATLGRRGTHRLDRFDPQEWPLIVCDEAHHSVAPTYMNIFEHFQVFDNSAKLLVGWTATPRRGDKIGLDSVYQDIVFHRDIREMIESGWLCPISAYRVRTDTDLTGVRTSHGDFIESDLSEAVDIPARNRLVVDAYRSYCAEKRTLVFCVNRSHTYDIARTFQAQGIDCAVVLGETPPDERAGVLDAFRTGEVSVVANCMVLTEGYDLPELGAIIMARPTQSPLLYTQMVGRGLRIAPDKDSVVVVDLADNSYRHHLINLPILFGLPGEFDSAGGSITEMVEEMEEMTQLKPEAAIRHARSLAEMRKIIEEFDIFTATSELDETVITLSKLSWVPIEDGYCLTLPDRSRLVICPNILDRYEVSLYQGGVGNTRIAVGGSLQQAFRAGDQYMMVNRQDEVGLFWQRARWRHELATDKQKSLISYWGIPFPDTLTKGQANLIISRKVSQKKNK